MIRPVVRATRPLCAERQCLTSQRRFKTFVRRVDKNNEEYYTLARRGERSEAAGSSRQQEFFEMPDVILDLDSEGLEGVRSFEDADEHTSAAKWGVSRKKQAARETLKSLEAELEEARQKADDVLSNPTNIWRLTSHDLLSAALNGAKPVNKGTQPTSLNNQTSSAILDSIRRENGVPAHVQDSDALLLEWLQLRQTNLKRFRKENDDHIATKEQLIEALRQQSTILGIRRLVHRQLSAPEGLKAYFGQTDATDISGEIRNACNRVLASDTAEHSDHIDALVFIGNLTDRLRHAKFAMDGRLFGLALRLSAEGQALEAAYEWLHRSHTGGGWPEAVEFADDACAAIRALELRAQAEGSRLVDDQFLLQLLTGLDETGMLAPDSFRALAGFYSQGDSATGQEIYGAYVSLLGHIGAVRTLLKEQQLCADEFGASAAKKLAPVFEEAISRATEATGGVAKSDIAEVSLDECVTLDYHALESLGQ
ncbi:hypothetical protein K4F52_008528 [Lecanicillium sp. MT-2017a]|nr:hypothetical protein K4F52_008528 [Lecanicillium sp. MT-2017a]